MATELGQLYYSLKIEDEQFKTTLEQVKQDLKAADNQILTMANMGGKGLTDAFSATGRSIEQIISQMKLLEQAYKKLETPDTNPESEKMRGRWQELQAEASKYGFILRSTTMEQKSYNQVMAMQANSVQQIQMKMAAINQTRQRENTLTKEGKANISSLNAEYNRLNNSLKDLGVKQRNLNENILNMARIGNEVKGQIQSVFSIYALERFISRMIDIRGQFELQQTSLRSILQDRQAADTIFAQVVELGLKSPFTTMEINQYVKQLAAYRIETEELFETTKRLSDVSAGLGVDMGRLILAYGQVNAASVLRGQEVRQFTEAGIPLIAELADKFSILEGRVVSTNEVFDKISKRLVPFQMVKEVFEDMTDIGGIFYNMQEIQSETLYGKVQNLADAFDLMFNDIGKANDGILKGSVDLLWRMVENWEAVAAAIKTVVFAYGAYRVAAAMANGMTRMLNIQATMLVRTLVTLRAVSTTTWIGLGAGALVGLVTAFIQFNNVGKSSTEMMNEFNASLEKAKNNINQLDKAIDTYETLSKKTELTANEQKRLEAITAELARTVPSATQAIDGQTEALKNQRGELVLSIEKLKEYSAERTKLQRDILKAEIEKKEREAEEIQRNLDGQLEKKYFKNREAKGDMFAQKERIDPSSLSLGAKRLREQWLNEWGDINSFLENARKNYAVLNGETDESTKKLAKWVETVKGIIGKDDEIEFSRLMPSDDDSISEYMKKIREAYKENAATIKDQANIVDGDVQKNIKLLEEQQKVIEKIAETVGFSPISESEQKKGESAAVKAAKEAAKNILDNEKEIFNAHKRRLELVEKVRSAYLDLRKDAESLNNGTADGLRLSNEALAKIPEQLKELFKGDDFNDILSKQLFSDNGFKDFLAQMNTDIVDFRSKTVAELTALGHDIKDTNQETFLNLLNDFLIKGEKINFDKFKTEWDKHLKTVKTGIDARNKLFLEEPPEGSGFTFRLSKILSGVKNDITEKGQEISDAMAGATEEQKVELAKLKKIWEDAYKEGGMQSVETLAKSYFNQLLKAQKLDVDISSLGEASIKQLNRLKKALKDIEKEFTGDELKNIFDVSGLDFSAYKDKLDTTNLESVYRSLTRLVSELKDTAANKESIISDEDVENAEKELAVLKPILKIIETLFKTSKKGEIDIDAEKLKEVKGIADAVIDSVAQLGSAFANLGEATGNNGLKSFGEDLQFISKMAEGIASIGFGALSGDPKQIIAGATQIVTTLINAEAEYQKAKLDFLRQQISLQTKINALLIESIGLQKAGAGDGVLYDNWLNEFHQTYEAAKAAAGFLDNLLKENKDNPLVNNYGFIKHTVGKKHTDKDLADYLENIHIKTDIGKNKAFGFTIGKYDIFGTLLDKFPDLIKANGELDLGLAKTIASSEKFKGVGKETLEELIEYTEQYEAAMKSLDDQINTLFGEVGNVISNALIDSFENGKFAADDFFKSVQEGIGKMVDSLVMNMITAAIFGDMLDQYKEPIKEALLSEDPQKNITELMGQLVSDIADGSEAAANAVQIFADEKKKAGLGDIGGGGSSKGQLESGLARTTQESIDIMTGFLMSTQGMVSELRNNSYAHNLNLSAQVDILEQQLAQINAIRMFTQEIRDLNLNLPDMAGSLATIVRRGVKIDG
jgi:hypothetical protein